jgi:hypothetical protein
MTNQVVRWDEELAKHATKQASVERPAVGKISFRAGHMSYQNQPIQGNRLECIIIGAAHEHALYSNIIENRAFDPMKPESPTCFSLSLDGEAMVPHPQALRKIPSTGAQIQTGPDCTTCPYNAWGSDPKGGRGKACKEVRRMVILPKAAIMGEPIGVRKSEAAVMSIPVTSVKNWANYTSLLAGQFRRPAWAMVTEVSVGPHARNQFEVKFAPVIEIGNEWLGELIERAKQAEQLLMTPYAPPQAQATPQPMSGRKY